MFLEITGVYPNVGSPEGGTLITIYGNYFYDTSGEIEAFISGISTLFKLYFIPLPLGVPCKIVEYSTTWIKCITGPAPTINSIYPGKIYYTCDPIYNYKTRQNVLGVSLKKLS